jgi:potassium channel subfamily K, other eukaryote
MLATEETQVKMPQLTPLTSILTIGFGDVYPTSDNSRGFLFVFELVGIIFIGLVISSISKFVANISADKIVRMHQLHKREYTFGHSVTNEKELREKLGLPPERRSAVTSSSNHGRKHSETQFGELKIVGRTVTFHEKKAPARGGGRGGAARNARPKSRDAKMQAKAAASSVQEKRKRKRQKLLLLKEEKDRFDAMREIQDDTRRFKQYYSLGMAILAFSILWCAGALVFYFSEARLSSLTYFEALYFCFVALLTIGYVLLFYAGILHD